MDSFGLDGLSLNRIEFVGEAINFRVPPRYHNNRLVVVGLTNQGFSINHYLEAEGFQVIHATLTDALETIRWEQPTIALIEGGLHGEGATRLVQRLKADPLTRHTDLLSWVVEPPQLNKKQQVMYVSDLESLRQALNYLRKQSQAELPDKVRILDFGRAKKLQSTLANPRLHRFVNEIVDNWPTLLLAAYLGQNLEAVVNVEMLYYQFGFNWEESLGAISQLAKGGYVEPLEFEGCDPLFGVVAWEGQSETLAELGWAMQLPEYRQAVATLILARERAA